MNTKITPKDFFLHLGATVALYAATIALINLSLSIINYAVPDKLAGYFYSPSVAWPISMLLVLIPLLYVLEWVILRDISRIPEKAEFWIRRWRIYLTLFLSGATIVGDLIYLVNTYLSGEITLRFAYKVLAVLLIAGVVFVYYMLNRQSASASHDKLRKGFAAAGLVLVLAAVVGGFLVVGSPWKQRALRFDNQRVNDLSTIQSQIIYSYWSQKGALPPTLAELNDPISGYMAPVDPATDAAYGYTVKSKLSFELCADFDLPTQDTKGRGEYGRGGYGGSVTMDIAYPYPGGVQDSWKHEAGRACFSRTIDPERYPVNEKIRAGTTEAAKAIKAAEPVEAI